MSLLLFAMVIDRLRDEVRQEFPVFLFSDDIVICTESREQVEENIEKWRHALEWRAHVCGREGPKRNLTVRLKGKKARDFKYLG